VHNVARNGRDARGSTFCTQTMHNVEFGHGSRLDVMHGPSPSMPQSLFAGTAAATR